LQVPSQTKLMEERLISLVTKHTIQDIIFLGDIKHTIPSSTHEERTDVKNFLSVMKSYGTLHILPGNHDGNINRFLTPGIQLHPSDGFVFEGIGFTHGHRKPSPDVMHCDQVVIGRLNNVGCEAPPFLIFSKRNILSHQRPKFFSCQRLTRYVAEPL